MDFVWHSQDLRVLFTATCYECQEYFFFRYTRWLSLISFATFILLQPPFFIFLVSLFPIPCRVKSYFIAFFRINEKATKAEREKRPENGRKEEELMVLLTWISIGWILLQMTFRVNEAAGKRKYNKRDL